MYRKITQCSGLHNFPAATYTVQFDRCRNWVYCTESHSYDCNLYTRKLRNAYLLLHFSIVICLFYLYDSKADRKFRDDTDIYYKSKVLFQLEMLHCFWVLNFFLSSCTLLSPLRYVYFVVATACHIDRPKVFDIYIPYSKIYEVHEHEKCL